MSKKKKNQSYVESQCCPVCGLVQWDQVVTGPPPCLFLPVPSEGHLPRRRELLLALLRAQLVPLGALEKERGGWAWVGRVGRSEKAVPHLTPSVRLSPPRGPAAPARAVCLKYFIWFGIISRRVVLPAFWNGNWWAVSSKTTPDPTLFSLRVLCVFLF